MISLLKLAVLLFCVHTGQGRWLNSLFEIKGREASFQTELSREESAGEGVRTDEEVSVGGAVRSRRSAESPCGLRSILIKVRELGLGYDSDETVLFKYCSGACPRVTSNHDLTLANLLLSGALPAEDLWYNAPCCRPTQHADIVFLDNANKWNKVEKLSAAACSCVG
ncbi:persephin [Chanos chanos]|uniref:Persephin n=1 Tax=Chanos chanos TaxID=29144 RepID=A0A6J2W382_CHACN|nr:persephin-like [Chanos chanos]